MNIELYRNSYHFVSESTWKGKLHNCKNLNRVNRYTTDTYYTLYSPKHVLNRDLRYLTSRPLLRNQIYPYTTFTNLSKSNPNSLNGQTSDSRNWFSSLWSHVTSQYKSSNIFIKAKSKASLLSTLYMIA